MQTQQRKPTVREKLVNLSEQYLDEQDTPLMDVASFLEKWVPYFFPGINLYERKKRELYFSLAGKTLEVTYKEACALLLSRLYPSVTYSTLTSWGAIDAMNCPESYRAGLYHIDVALEMSLLVKKMVEQQQAAQQQRTTEQQAA